MAAPLSPARDRETCPKCGGSNLHQWTPKLKTILETGPTTQLVCDDCGHTYKLDET